QDSPVSVAYLDMNGLKPINDKHGHAAADEVIRTYLGAISSVVGGAGEAYRLYDGGDEGVVIMRGTGAKTASKLMRGLLQQLSKERVTLPDGFTPTLTASCGIVTTRAPNESTTDFLNLADQTMQRAKETWKSHNPRVNTLAVGSEAPFIVECAPPT